MVEIIYWSGTGNTEAMADAIALGVESGGQSVNKHRVNDITVEQAAKSDVLALGCADMGVEELEEYEFAPFFAELEAHLSGKKVAIFGSYGWGGTWVNDWFERLEQAGAVVIADPLTCLGYPDADCLKQCEKLGAKLAQA